MKNRTNTNAIAYLLSGQAEQFSRELMRKRSEPKASEPHAKGRNGRQIARLLKRQGE